MSERAAAPPAERLSPAAKGFLDEAARSAAPARSGLLGWWQRHRGAVVVVSVLTLAVALSLALTPRSAGEPLAPDNPAPEGARALARILEDRGVSVRPEDRFDAVAPAPGVTVLVIEPSLLSPERLRELRGSGADLVLVRPGLAVLGVLAPELTIGGVSDPYLAGPGCRAEDAVAAGEARGGGSRYVEAPATATGVGGERPSPTAEVEVCYSSGEGPTPEAGSFAVVDDPAQDRRVTVVGQPEVLTNAQLGAAGNAALAIRSLGRQPELVWYRVDPLDVPPGEGLDSPPTVLSLLPDWVRWVAWQLVVVTLVVVAWRFRRLGRLVAERLPVVVRSAENAEGRARLYRRARARQESAELLRAASRRRLADRLGAGAGASAPEVSQLVAAATGQAPTAVGAVLHGPPPGDDAGLVRLADELDRLEREVTRQ